MQGVVELERRRVADEAVGLPPRHEAEAEPELLGDLLGVEAIHGVQRRGVPRSKTPE